MSDGPVRAPEYPYRLELTADLGPELSRSLEAALRSQAEYRFSLAAERRRRLRVDAWAGPAGVVLSLSGAAQSVRLWLAGAGTSSLISAVAFTLAALGFTFIRKARAVVEAWTRRAVAARAHREAAAFVGKALEGAPVTVHYDLSNGELSSHVPARGIFLRFELREARYALLIGRVCCLFRDRAALRPVRVIWCPGAEELERLRAALAAAGTPITQG